MKINIELIIGGSGRWVAREVVDRHPNGKVAVVGRTWTGHVPRPIRADEDTLTRHIEKNINRKPDGGDVSRYGVTAPRGGAVYDMDIEVGDQPFPPEKDN